MKVEKKNKKKEDTKFRGRGRGRDGRSQRGYGGRRSDFRPWGDNKLTKKQEGSLGRGRFSRGRGPNTSWRGRNKNQWRAS